MVGGFYLKETRKCFICPELFVTKISSNRKTCSTKCSRKYQNRPDVKERRKESQKEYRDRPDVKERKKEYRDRPDVKEHLKEYRDRPDVKERRKESQKYYYIKNKL